LLQLKNRRKIWCILFYYGIILCDCNSPCNYFSRLKIMAMKVEFTAKTEELERQEFVNGK